MLDVLVRSLGFILLICLGVILLLIPLVLFCCKICKKNKKSSSRRDVERGLENAQQDGSVPEDGLTSSSTLYRRITEPEIINGKLYGQDFFAIKERLDITQSLFLDDKFPADKYSISYNGKMKGKSVDCIVDEWVRASQLYKNPEMVKNGITKDDVNQGHLGDCWMLAAMADLSEKEGLFQWVVPAGQTFNTGYNGLFLFRFWRYGQWVEVVVDDLIPVKNKKPVFVHSKNRGEMWPCLLEKAYSKLQGSYNHLNAGMPMSALVDFTGGFPRRLYGTRELMAFSRGTLFTLRLSQEAETKISVSQMGRRQLRDEMRTEATLLNIKFSVFPDGGNKEIAGQTFLALRTRTFQEVLKAGTYRIIAEAEKVDKMTGIFLRVASTNKQFNLS